MKTFRFTSVVQRSGKPETYALWVAPEQDPEFQRALKANLVMTVRQETAGGKKDFGTVGYDPGVPGELLVFPKSIKSFTGGRVVGINYDLLKKAPPAEPAQKAVAPLPAPPVEKAKPAFAPVESKPKAAPLKAETAPAKFKVVRSKPAKKEPTSPKKEALPKPVQPKPSRANSTNLEKEVRKAMKALQAGKAVAAYQILEKATSSPK